MLRHNRVELALHAVGRRDGTIEPDQKPLLLLHGLGERAPSVLPEHLSWPGPVFGLDFTGHGRSTIPAGGGYTSEVLVGDVDAALCHLDRPVTILGRGLGAYVGLLCAAARSDVVHGMVMADGPGLAGGGVHPGSRALVTPASSDGPPDPFALMELARDVRPPDYARTVAGLAIESSGLETPLWVGSVVRPAWVGVLIDTPGVGSGPVQSGLDSFAPTTSN